MKFNKVRLFKMTEEEAQSRDWDDLKHLSEDLGYSVEEIKSLWFIDFEPEYQEIELSDDVPMKEIEGNIIVARRIYPIYANGHVLTETETEMFVAIHDLGELL